MSAIVSAYQVTATAAGISLTPPTKRRAYDVVVIPEAGSPITIGEQGAETFPVPESGMSLGDVHRYSNEESWDLDKIFIKGSGVVNVLVSEIRDGN